MKRRAFLAAALMATNGARLLAALRSQRWEDAVAVLEKSAASRQVDAAALHVNHKGESFTRAVGKAGKDSMFLLGSISKPINMAAAMTMFDQKKFQLDDPVRKYLPAFTGEGRERVTIHHLLTHTSGLPDQLPSNNAMRKRHATLLDFVEETTRTPVEFAPGSKYQYSSMGILLMSRIASLVSGIGMLELVEKNVFKPLGMKRSAQGLGRFQRDDFVPAQMEGAAPESGSGDPQAEQWNWNSLYWRKLGAPWGGTHCSASDLGLFLDEFLHARGKVVRPETARLMTRNHNPAGFTQRGLGFTVGKDAGSPGCSEQTFGHGGSTGTICWADPATDTICVVLTSLPRRAATPHPRELAANLVAAEAAR